MSGAAVYYQELVQILADVRAANGQQEGSEVDALLGELSNVWGLMSPAEQEAADPKLKAVQEGV
jgi:hypothetical protein